MKSRGIKKKNTHTGALFEVRCLFIYYQAIQCDLTIKMKV